MAEQSQQQSTIPAASGPASSSTAGVFSGYRATPGSFDELFDETGQPRADFRPVVESLGDCSTEELARLQGLAEISLLHQGVTFSVYADERGTEKIFPFCLVPRLISADDWTRLERGLCQRITALSLFLDDI